MSERLESLLSAAFTSYVKENENADVSQLILKGGTIAIDKKEAAQQILSRQKAKGKLPHWLSNENIVFPPPLSIEQSSSQLTAEYKKKLIKGNQIIDLTGGMGVDVITLSDQFQSATHVEIDAWLSEVFEHNSKILAETPITAVNDSAENFLKEFHGQATFFIDPARRDHSKKKVFLFEDCSPDVIALLPLLQQKADHVLIKAAPMIDLSMGIKQLKYVSEVHVVSLHNECKEVLFLLDFGLMVQPLIHCVNIKAENTESFTFDFESEKEAKVQYGSAQKYLYEPNASIRKAGAFKSIAQHFDLSKIAPNTHLYTSTQLIQDFPGRVFEVLDEVHKKDVKGHFTERKANVISKNHPLTAEQLKKKFGLKDGGDEFLIGFKNIENGTQLVVAKRLPSL